MTLGQRIQELRRQQNLSQEALGEKLGVSRQAISKWESDLTIPELDKLIALSKLFGVPMGQLLGVEEEIPAPAEEQPGESGGLTEREAAAVENIAGRYLEAATGREKKFRKILMAAACVELAALMLIGFCFLKVFDRLGELKNRVALAENRMNYLDSSIDSRVGAAIERMQSALDESESLVENWNYELTDVQRGGLCTLELWVAPKVYEPWSTAALTLTAGDRSPVTVEGEWDGQVFRFTAKLYVEDYVEVRYTQTSEGGVQQTESLDDIGGLANSTRLDVEVSHSGGWNVFTWGQPKKINLFQNITFDVKGYGASDFGVEPQSLQLRLVKNGVVVDRREIELERFVDDPTRWYKEEKWEMTPELEEGETYVLNYCLEDSLGQVYQGDIFRYVIEKNSGRLIPADQPMEAQSVTSAAPATQID